MSIQEIVEILTTSGIEQREAAIEVKMLIEHFCGYNAVDILMGRPLDYKKLEIVKQKAILRAETKMPIQYIIGQAYFMGDYYKVTEDVLIPRDETELSVVVANSIIKNKLFKSVLDIGTGTGCIACNIAKTTGAKVIAVDISEKALSVAKSNVEKLQPANVELIQSDLFENIQDRKFDLIISNPPYIPVGTDLQEEVRFEPELALFAEGDGTGFYKSIIEQASKYLNVSGYVVFELGIDQAETVKSYFEANGFKEIIIEKDLAGIDRVISAHL